MAQGGTNIVTWYLCFAALALKHLATLKNTQWSRRESDVRWHLTKWRWVSDFSIRPNI